VKTSSSRLWKLIARHRGNSSVGSDQLMGRRHAPVSAAVGALELHQFFDEKVASVCASTADAPEPTFSTVPSGCWFCTFRRLTANDVIYVVRLLPASDPLPTNRSMMCGVVSTLFKSAYIPPLLKKLDLDPADAKS